MNPGHLLPKPLGDILVFKNGKSIKPGGIGKYPVYGSNGIIGGCDEFREQNGIILGRVGAYCGSVSYYPGKFWASDNTIVVYPKCTEYDVLFLSYFLRELNLNRWAGGAAQPLLTQTVLKQVIAPVPSLPTQLKIAAILSAYDDLIANNLRRIKILEEMAQNLYREWFIKFRFPGHQHARFTDSPIGRIPEGWDVVTVEQIVKREPSGKKYDQKTVSATGTVPVLDQGRSGTIGYHDDEPGVLASEDAPIIVFANHTCYQRLIMFSFSAIQNVLPFIPSPEYPRNIYWLHYATKDLITFNDYKGHWPEFMAKELILPLPNACQQFGGFVEPLTRLIYKLEKRNEVLRRTRDLLLPRLISSEMDVSELDISIPEAVGA